MEGLPRVGRASRRPKRGRLSRSAEFDRVYRQGRSVGNRFAVLYSFPRSSAGEPADGARLGVSVSRKVGGAVDRNRVKRLLREAFSTLAARVPADHDVVVVARPDLRELAEREGLEGVTRELSELVDKAGGSAEPTMSDPPAQGSLEQDSSAAAPEPADHTLATDASSAELEPAADSFEDGPSAAAPAPGAAPSGDEADPA